MKSCLGVPRHFSNDPEFLHDAMRKMDGAHDRLLDLTKAIANEDPFATMRLLQTCGISKFGHVLSDVPPALAQDFARERYEAITATFATIQQSPTPENYTHASPVRAEGVGLTSPEAHVAARAGTSEPSSGLRDLSSNGFQRWEALRIGR